MLNNTIRYNVRRGVANLYNIIAVRFVNINQLIWIRADSNPKKKDLIYYVVIQMESKIYVEVSFQLEVYHFIDLKLSALHLCQFKVIFLWSHLMEILYHEIYNTDYQNKLQFQNLKGLITKYLFYKLCSAEAYAVPL